MPMSVLSRNKGFIALVAVVCLAAVIASTWRAHSQTRQVARRDQAQRPMDRMIEGLKRGGAEFPEVELFQEQEATASALTLRRAAPQDVLSKGVILNPDGRMALRLASGEIPAMTLRLPDPSGKAGVVELELANDQSFPTSFRVDDVSVR